MLLVALLSGALAIIVAVCGFAFFSRWRFYRPSGPIAGMKFIAPGDSAIIIDDAGSHDVQTMFGMSFVRRSR